METYAKTIQWIDKKCDCLVLILLEKTLIFLLVELKDTKHPDIEKIVEQLNSSAKILEDHILSSITSSDLDVLSIRFIPLSLSKRPTAALFKVQEITKIKFRNKNWNISFDHCGTSIGDVLVARGIS